MKKSVVAIYDRNSKAISAVKHLVTHGIPAEELSIVGQGQLIEDHIHFIPVKKAKVVTPYIGLGIGAVLGLIVGMGWVEIPGFAKFFDTGAVAILGGLVMGAVVGGLSSVVFSLIFRHDDLVMMQKHIDNGKYMLVVKGSLEDIEKSKKLLHTENIHEEIIDVEG